MVQVYQDGSVQLNHGGTEMGQGVYIKVAEIVAEAFGIDIDRVRITATNTGKVPNTSPTAASSGTDLNGAAARNAAMAIRNRMTEFFAEHFKVAQEVVAFEENAVHVGEREMSFGEACKLAYLNRVSLSATGFYKTPKIWWNREEGRGRPFYYFAYGAACTEAAIDTLTGGIPDHPGRHPPRLRRQHQSGHRPGAGGGRLRPGHGLADGGGTVVGRGRAGCAPMRRRPTRSRPPATCRRRSMWNWSAECPTGRMRFTGRRPSVSRR